MIDSSRLFHFVKIVGPVVLIIWALGYYTTPSDRTEFLRKFQNERTLFVKDFLDVEIDGRFDGAGISKLCAARNWDRDLIMSCEPPQGGIGLAKNAHLHCIRTAMELGAALVLPDIVRRSDVDISKLVKHPSSGPTRGEPLDYFFDANRLNWTLSNYCPQMKLYRSMNDLHDVPSVLEPHKFGYTDMVKEFRQQSVVVHPEQLAEGFRTWLDKAVPPEKRKRPIRVHLDVSLFRFPIDHDSLEFSKNFGRILRVREPARRLAASALFNIGKKFKLDLDPRKGIKDLSFVGVHLRTEKDVDEKGFPAYEDQAAQYLQYAVSSGAKVIFLATGATQEDIDVFRERASDFGISVVLKKDILSPEEFAEVQKMTWDQRALVDYEILLNSGLMTGTSMSSFAWNIALRRQHALGNDLSNGAPVGDSHEVQWHDKFSAIYGPSNTLVEAMKMTIWP